MIKNTQYTTFKFKRSYKGKLIYKIFYLKKQYSLSYSKCIHSIMTLSIQRMNFLVGSFAMFIVLDWKTCREFDATFITGLIFILILTHRNFRWSPNCPPPLQAHAKLQAREGVKRVASGKRHRSPRRQKYRTCANVTFVWILSTPCHVFFENRRYYCYYYTIIDIQDINLIKIYVSSPLPYHFCYFNLFYINIIYINTYIQDIRTCLKIIRAHSSKKSLALFTIFIIFFFVQCIFNFNVMWQNEKINGFYIFNI